MALAVGNSLTRTQRDFYSDFRDLWHRAAEASPVTRGAIRGHEKHCLTAAKVCANLEPESSSDIDSEAAASAVSSLRNSGSKGGLNLFRDAPLLHLHRYKHWTSMAQPIPFSRNAGAARARHAKAMLLPMPRPVADELALRVHVALDTLRRGVGSKTDAQTLTQIVLLTGFLAELGYGSVSGEELGAADRAAAAVFDIGRETGEWKLDSVGFALFASIATIYDRQLHSAPLWAVTDASERLDRFIAGVPDRTSVRKRA
jgi:hypothetical protein